MVLIRSILDVLRAMAVHRPAPSLGRPIRGALGTILGAYKAATTRAIRGGTGLSSQTPAAIWQRNYYDIIIHDDRALNNIRRYIRDNPAHWNPLRYGEPRFFAGNRGLLDMPLPGNRPPHSARSRCRTPADYDAL